MSRSTKNLSVLFLVGAMLLPSVSSAQSVADLQAQIQALLAQIQQLQAQLAARGGGETAPPAFCHNFNENLRVGDKNSAIASLQTALEKEGFSISNDIDGVFGEGTASAVSGFQEKYRNEILNPVELQHGNGYVGRLTRAKLNSLFGCAVPQPTPLPVPIPDIPTAQDQSSVTIISPNGGEVFTQGESNQIRWQGDTIQDVDVLLADTNGNQIGYIFFRNPSAVGVPNIISNWDARIVNSVPDISSSDKTVYIVPGSYKILIVNRTTGARSLSAAPFNIVSSAGITAPSVTQVVPQSPLANLRINYSDGPVVEASPGSTLTLTWTSQGGVRCSASSVNSSWSGPKQPVGIESITVPNTGVMAMGFNIDCYDANGGTGQDSIAVNVSSRPILTFSRFAGQNTLFVTRNTPSSLVGRFSFAAGGSEDINLSAITFLMTGEIGPDYLHLQNLKITAQGKQMGATAFAVNAGASYMVVPLSPIKIPANGEIEVDVFADVLDATPRTYEAPILVRGATGSIVAKGARSNIPAMISGNSNSNGQDIVVGGAN